MPVIEIYRNGKKIGSENFRTNFYIVEDLNNEFYWEMDKEQGRSRRGGELHIWIQPDIVGHRIPSVRPDWQLTIDNVKLAQKLHVDVNVVGKLVSLHHKDYEFVCQFPGPD